MKTGVQFDQVAALLEANPELSAIQIRANLGTGSLGTITAHRRKWLEERQPGVAVGNGWKDRVVEQLTEIEGELTRRDHALAVSQDEVKLLAQENEKLTLLAETLAEKNEALSQEVENLRKELAKAIVRIEEYPARISALEQEISQGRLELKAENERSRKAEIDLAVALERLAKK